MSVCMSSFTSEFAKIIFRTFLGCWGPRNIFGGKKYANTDVGLELLIRAYVDADYAGDPISGSLRTGFIIMANMVPIY